MNVFFRKCLLNRGGIDIHLIVGILTSHITTEKCGG